MKYHKKPVVIDAIRFEDNARTISLISDMVGKEIRVNYQKPKKPVLKIKTLEGTMTAQIGDWIIRGVHGECYPCKHEIFRMTYEKVVP